MTKSTSVFKENTHAILKKAIAIGILGGALWGSAFAADQASSVVPVTMAVPPTVQSAPVAQPQSTAKTAQQDSTFYDKLVEARSNARNQVEADAAIFLVPGTPAADSTAPNAVNNTARTAQQGEAAYRYGKLREQNGNRGYQNNGPREFKDNDREVKDDNGFKDGNREFKGGDRPEYNHGMRVAPMKPATPVAVTENPQPRDEKDSQYSATEDNRVGGQTMAPGQMALLPPRMHNNERHEGFERNGQHPVAFMREGERRDGFKREGARGNFRPDGMNREDNRNFDGEHRDGFRHDGMDRDHNPRFDGEHRDGFRHDGMDRDHNPRFDGEHRDGFRHDGEKRDGEHHKHHVKKKHHDNMVNNGQPGEHPDFPNNGDRPDNR